MEADAMAFLDVIADLKVREPFEPFRIVISCGDKYLLENGDNLIHKTARDRVMQRT